MSVRGTVAGAQPERLADLESGTVAVRTLTEALAINQSRLLSNVIPDAPAALVDAVSAASGLGILARMSAIGAALRTHLEKAARVRLAAHPSDTVRGVDPFHHRLITAGGFSGHASPGATGRFR